MRRMYAAAFAVMFGLEALGATAQAAPPTYKIIYSFLGGSDGSGPSGLTRVADLLYGATSSGGANGEGTIFSLSPATGAERILYSFNNAIDGYDGVGLTNVHGTLFGMNTLGGLQNCNGGCGTVFSLDTKNNTEKLVYSFQGDKMAHIPSGSWSMSTARSTA